MLMHEKTCVIPILYYKQAWNNCIIFNITNFLLSHTHILSFTDSEIELPPFMQSEKHLSTLESELSCEEFVKKLSVLYFEYSGWSSAASESDMSVSMAAMSVSEKKSWRWIKYLSLKLWLFSLSINLNICFGCSKELPQWDGSFELPQYNISYFIQPFILPYIGVIPNLKMAFIFTISCILVLIFPIFMIYFPKCEGKGSFPKSQIKSLNMFWSWNKKINL